MGNQATKQQKDRSKKNVHWKSAEPPLPPGKPYLLPGISTDEPDVVTIKWLKPRSDNGSSIIGYIVEHRRTGSPHWVRASPQLVQFTELALSGLEPGWRYQFRVIAENAVGKSEASECSDPLTVTLQRNAVQIPRFTIELEDLIGIENERVEFKVSVIGSPAPQIAWFKDGFEIFSSRRTKIVSDNDSSTLVFYQASLTDGGEIKCTATNRAGYAFTRSNLTIEAPPKIRLPRQYEDGLIIEVEEVVRLKVGIAGKPTPSVIWTHNGEILSTDGRYEIINTDKNSSLKINNSSRTDRGEYNLRAINKLGEDNASFLVTVTASPLPPGKVEVNILLGNAVTLSWSPPQDDGGCKIGNYIVEYFRIGWNMWLKAATSRQLSVTLSDLIEGSEYKFRVRAENPFGIGSFSEESEILFIPDLKRGITKPVKDSKMLMIDQIPPVAPKRRNPSPSPVRNNHQDNIGQMKRSPVPHELNTNIFDDDNLERDMAYGTSNDFYMFKEVSAKAIKEKNGLEEQVRQLRAVKHNVKFKIDEENEIGESLVIYENLRQAPDDKRTKANSESQTSGKRTYGDMSRIGRSDAPSSIQNSSEFMLVLYPDSKESKSSTTNGSYDLEMEEYFAPPPPLSQSAPELNVTIPDGPAMRYAVSSTELLYERAMARFYKAVEFEENENARKRSISVEQESRRRSFSFDQERRSSSNDHAVRLGNNNLSETERMSVLKRRLSGETTKLHINIPRKLSFKDSETDNTLLNTIRNELNTPDMIERSPSPFSTPLGEKESYDDDYSDSTTESSNESEDVPTRRSRQRSNDVTTFPPRMLSPYRQPENSEAAAVLTKPLPPLPDPNFVPRPILKRPASADGRKPKKPGPKTTAELIERRSASPSPARSPRSQRKSVEIDEVPKIIQPREIEYNVESLHKEKSLQDLPQIKVDQPERPVEMANQFEPDHELEPDAYTKPINLVKKKLIERRQSSLEENHVMADFYNDIIKDLSVRTVKPKIHMSPEELTKLEIQEDEAQIDSGLTSSTDLSPPSTLSRPLSPPSFKTRTESPATINRRASEFAKPLPTGENELIFGRRLSESAKVRLENLSNLQSQKDMLLQLKDRTELTKSPSPVNNLLSNGSVQQKVDGLISTSSTEEVQSRGRMKPKTGAIPKRRNQSQSRSRDSSVQPVPKNPVDSTILQRREKSSSRTRNRSESKSPSTLNRRIIINRFAPPKVSTTDAAPRAITPSELQEQVQLKVKSTMAYGTDVSILIFATYIYFKSAILALPIIALLLYRQISDKLPDWIKRKKS